MGSSSSNSNAVGGQSPLNFSSNPLIPLSFLENPLKETLGSDFTNFGHSTKDITNKLKQDTLNVGNDAIKTIDQRILEFKRSLPTDTIFWRRTSLHEKKINKDIKDLKKIRKNIEDLDRKLDKTVEGGEDWVRNVEKVSSQILSNASLLLPPTDEETPELDYVFTPEDGKSTLSEECADDVTESDSIKLPEIIQVKEPSSVDLELRLESKLKKDLEEANASANNLKRACKLEQKLIKQSTAKLQESIKNSMLPQPIKREWQSKLSGLKPNAEETQLAALNYLIQKFNTFLMEYEILKEDIGKLSLDKIKNLPLTYIQFNSRTQSSGFVDLVFKPAKEELNNIHNELYKRQSSIKIASIETLSAVEKVKERIKQFKTDIDNAAIKEKKLKDDIELFKIIIKPPFQFASKTESSFSKKINEKIPKGAFRGGPPESFKNYFHAKYEIQKKIIQDFKDKFNTNNDLLLDLSSSPPTPAEVCKFANAVSALQKLDKDFDAAYANYEQVKTFFTSTPEKNSLSNKLEGIRDLYNIEIPKNLPNDVLASLQLSQNKLKHRHKHLFQIKEEIVEEIKQAKTAEDFEKIRRRCLQLERDIISAEDRAGAFSEAIQIKVELNKEIIKLQNNKINNPDNKESIDSMIDFLRKRAAIAMKWKGGGNRFANEMRLLNEDNLIDRWFKIENALKDEEMVIKKMKSTKEFFTNKISLIEIKKKRYTNQLIEVLNHSSNEAMYIKAWDEYFKNMEVLKSMKNTFEV